MGTTSPNYVRFIRGTPKAWANLKVKDEDCLYFIANKNASTGQLYLGSKLISGSDSSDAITDIIAGYSELKNLNDVFLSLNVSDGSVLTYRDGYWVDEKLNIPTDMIGATKTDDGEHGLVPTPKAGEEKFYLRGDGTWDDLGGTLEAYMFTLYEADSRSDSIRTIASKEVQKIFGYDVPEEYDTIEKIAKWIVQNGIDDGQGTGAERLEALEVTVYGVDKTSKTNGIQKTQNDILDIINGYNRGPENQYEGLRPTVRRLDADVFALDEEVSKLRDKYTNINSKVTDLSNRLQWQKYND